VSHRARQYPVLAHEVPWVQGSRRATRRTDRPTHRPHRGRTYEDGRMNWKAKQHGPDWVVVCDDGSMIVIGDALYHPENEGIARIVAAAPNLLACVVMWLEHG